MVAQSSLAVAFLDTAPVAAGHALVVPRRHAGSLAELTAAEGEAVFALARHLATVIRAELAPAVNLHLSDGAEAGQEVEHVHLHVIPRHSADSVRLHLPASTEVIDAEEVASRLAPASRQGTVLARSPR